MKNIISIILYSLCLMIGISRAQNITNTLGTSGLFSIKDGSSTFLSLNQANGFLSLNKGFTLSNTSDSSTGIIFKGIDRFIHNYQAPGSYGFNTFVGVNAGNFTMSGIVNHASFNTSVGSGTLRSLTSGFANSAFGSSSLSNNTTGDYNSASGYYSLTFNATGSNNSAFGANSLSSNTTGNYNSAFGSSSLSNNTTGLYNSAFGYNSLLTNTTGQYNCASGYYSLTYNLTGSNNSAYGVFSLVNNTTGQNNCASGYYSLSNNTTGSNNSAFGANSLYYNTTGDFNSASGGAALFNNTTGHRNSALGYYSLTYNSTGVENTAVGYKSLFLNASGVQNTAVGDSALYNNTGNYNTAIGYNAGSSVTTGANLTLIGIDANPSSGSAVDEITLGNIYVQHLRCNVQTITSLSDRRDKKNIRDLNLGIDFLMKLRPRQFNWDKRDWYENKVSDGSKMQKAPTAGFIAQELDSAQTIANAEWLNLVLKDNPDKWEATPGNLFPIIVKAIQQLKVENDSLKAQLEDEKEIKEQVAEIKILKEELNEQIKLLEAKNQNDVIKFSSITNRERTK